MKIKTGIDIVYIPEFKEHYEKNLLDKVFNNINFKNKNIEHAAGVFSAKEAILKALNLKPGTWNDIEITWKDSGKPIANVKKQPKIKCIDISISHTKDYAVASCVVLMT